MWLGAELGTGRSRAGAEARRGEEGDEAAEAMEKRRERPTS
jgi:hypothetical protein